MEFGEGGTCKMPCRSSTTAKIPEKFLDNRAVLAAENRVGRGFWKKPRPRIANAGKAGIEVKGQTWSRSEVAFSWNNSGILSILDALGESSLHLQSYTRPVPRSKPWSWIGWFTIAAGQKQRKNAKIFSQLRPEKPVHLFLAKFLNFDDSQKPEFIVF